METSLKLKSGQSTQDNDKNVQKQQQHYDIAPTATVTVAVNAAIATKTASSFVSMLVRVTRFAGRALQLWPNFFSGEVAGSN